MGVHPLQTVLSEAWPGLLTRSDGTIIQAAPANDPFGHFPCFPLIWLSGTVSGGTDAENQPPSIAGGLCTYGGPAPSGWILCYEEQDGEVAVQQSFCSSVNCRSLKLHGKEQL